MLALEIRSRGKKDPADALRKRGVVPAVFYGPKEEATAIAVEARALEHVWRQAGQTSVVTLQGVGEDKDALIHDAQFHPVTGALLHADFYVLEKGKKVRIKVPLEWEGEAPAEKSGHVIVKALHEIEIEVAPQELPRHLVVNLSALEKVGDRVTASRIKLPPGAALLTNGEEIVASVTEFEEEPSEIAPAPETVITTGKPEALAGESGAAATEDAQAPSPSPASKKEKKE